jgi:curved DNA-binding protein CbpA
MRAETVTREGEDHYAVLGVPKNATAEEITAAYRRRAKLLHPDVPETGNRAAFLRLGEAYQTLGDPIRRAAYDQSVREVTRAAWRQDERPLAFVAPLRIRVPRFLGAGLVIVTLLALGQAGWRIFGPSMAPQPGTTHIANASPSVAVSPAARPTLAAAPALNDGDHYIIANPAPAILWQRNPDGAGLHRAGQIPSFAVVSLIRAAGDDGMAEIRTAGGAPAFVEAARLMAGDAKAARNAACLFNAGAPPRGGSMLVRPSGGEIRVVVENREERPAVFKLRDAREAVVAAVYLPMRGQAVIENLPVGQYRAEFAMGDLWSGQCGRFMAGMRAQRLPTAQEFTGPARFAISGTTLAEDISDDAFSRDAAEGATR